MSQGSEELTFVQKEALKFLDRDFNQCFEQMRHDDDQICDFFKFAFTAYTALVGIALGLYQFGLKENVNLTCPVAVSIVIGFIVGIFIFILTLRKRVYFVQLARYINEQRGLFFAHMPLGFKNESRMYVSAKEPAFFNWRSSHAWIIYLIAILNSILFGVLLYILQGRSLCSLIPDVIMSWGLQLLIGVLYLKTRENKSASAAIFGKK